MRSLLWVESFSGLDRNEDFSHLPWCFGDEPSRWGHPLSGHVAYFYALDRNKGLFSPPILNYFAMGSPYGSNVVFLPTRSD